MTSSLLSHLDAQADQRAAFLRRTHRARLTAPRNSLRDAGAGLATRLGTWGDLAAGEPCQTAEDRAIEQWMDDCGLRASRRLGF